ncbi:MAG: sulfatase [Gemmataceae bacterium]|nr:sulfatase [Gemmataceae bacterium]
MRWLLTTAVISFGAAVAPSRAEAQSATRNVLLIVADDLGLDLGCYGHPVIRTPNLDALAKRGVRFAKAYATVASCSPSRASVYTGLFTHQNGQYGLQHAPHSQQTHSWVVGLPRLLRLAGYYTGIIGKVHVGPAAVYGWEVEVTKGTGRNGAAIADRAREFFAAAGKKPFFLVVGYIDPHRAKVSFDNEKFEKDAGEVRYDPAKVVVPPYLPDLPEVRRDLAEYYQAVSRLDRHVGLLLKVLAESGHGDDTLIIFISDNGIPFPGAKTTLYEAGVHLPMILAGPGVPAGRTSDAMVSFVDITPTVLDWCQAKGPNYSLPGRSLLPILSEDRPKGWDVVFGSHQMHEITMMYPMRSITTRTHKYLVNLDHPKEFPFASDLWGSPSWQAVRRTGVKMLGQRSVVDYLRRPKEELYDLTTDPHEMKNVATVPANAAILADLRRRLRAWQQQTNDPWLILYRDEDAQFNR